MQSAAGLNAAATVVGNDTSGHADSVGKASAQAIGYIDQVDQNSFMVGAASVVAGQTYVFSYQVMQ